MLVELPGEPSEAELAKPRDSHCRKARPRAYGMEPFRPGRGQRASRCRHPRRGLLPALEESAVREGALVEPERAREPRQIVGIEIELLRGVPDLVLSRPEIEVEVQLLRQLDEPCDLARRVPASSDEAVDELSE